MAALVQGKGTPFDPSPTSGTVADVTKGMCDVREVSQAHVLCVEQDDAVGRYLLQTHDTHYEDMVVRVCGGFLAGARARA